MTIPMRFLAIFVFLCGQSAARDLGQAAGVAAHLAIEHGTEPRAVSIPELQKLLVARGQVIRHAKR
jgi:hypothetical protein